MKFSFEIICVVNFVSKVFFIKSIFVLIEVSISLVSHGLSVNLFFFLDIGHISACLLRTELNTFVKFITYFFDIELIRF